MQRSQDPVREFEDQHREVNPAALLSCFYACRGRSASLEEAFHHVYDNPGGCPWCQEWITKGHGTWDPFSD